MAEYVKCDYCQFDIPSNASVCGHCSAQYWTETIRHTGFWARISGMISVGFASSLFVYLMHIFDNDLIKWGNFGLQTILVIAGCIGAVFGWFLGTRTSTRYSLPPQ